MSRNLQPPSRIELEQWLERCENFFASHSMQSVITPSARQEMYDLWNDRNLPREQNSGCGSCITRVYKRLKNDYERRKEG